MSERPRRVHFVGIGGIGLSAIAKILLAQGDEVSGSDLKSSPMTDELAKLGAKVFIGHRAENVGDVELVLITSAAREDNPEILRAKRRGIHVGKRYDFFPELTKGKKVIAVAGTHGKTTATGMIANILVRAGLDPSVIVGGVIPELNGNARAGKGEYFVVEADEYDRAFLGLRPSVAVVTSIEMDHPDFFENVDEVVGAFREFMGLVASDGLIAGCGDSESVVRALKQVKSKVVRYGLGIGNDCQAVELKKNELGGTDFAVTFADESMTHYQLQIPGRHNVLNALAAIAVANHVGVNTEITREVLRDFRGAARRFEIKGEFGGVTIVDDYAHHPSEIRATLAAARERYTGRVIWAVFQPHTYSRTKALLDEFARAFDDADHVVVTEIFAARERNDFAVSAQDIVARMNHRDARFIANLNGAADFIARNLRSRDVLLTLGAGDVNRVGEQVSVKLNKGSGGD